MLSQTAEYALRAMAWMALQSPDEPVRANDLSEATGIPGHYLSKILRRMVVRGLLESRKGHGGGFTLARPRGAITFHEILDAVDAAPREGRCAFGWGRCHAEAPCPLHPAWSRLGGAFLRWANETTLADVRAIDDATQAFRTA